MPRVLAAILVVLMSFAALASDEAEAPNDMVVLTVGGLVGKTNRGPLDPKHDSLLAKLKVDFKNGFAFDRAMLLALPQGTVKAKPIEFEKEATFSGPLLREVLGYLEAAKVKTTFVAADGYSGYLMPEDIDGSDYILALSADGEPLGFGQQGPIWLLNTRPEGATVGADNRGSHVWAVVYMHVGE
ncbi:MAG: hypothetical protein R3D30_11370 [Hyphomicrobiales bacterium]